MMLKVKAAVIAAGLVVLAGGGAYAAYDYYAGNHVEVKEVISTTTTGGTAAGAAGGAVAASAINGNWSIQPTSEVYFSVTTSKETVNFAVKSVKGSWQLNAADASQNKAEGTVDLNALDSGNGQRDNHIKGNDYLQVANHPQAVFTVKSFEQLPQEWKEGQAAPFKMTGTLSLRGMTKEVTFDSKAQYDQGQLKVEGSTVVTFADFGMKNPHTVGLETENNVTVQLRLVLGQEKSA